MTNPYPTQPAFIHHAQGWDGALLRHPLMRFLHAHELLFDAKDYSACNNYYSPTLTYISPSGPEFDGQVAAVQSLNADYLLFSAHYHEPVYVTIVGDGAGGYRLSGMKRVYGNLASAFEGGVGEDGSGSGVKDLRGRRWEVVTQGAFLFDVVKDGGGPMGLRIERWQVMGDSVEVLREAVRRGVVGLDAVMGSK